MVAHDVTAAHVAKPICRAQRFASYVAVALATRWSTGLRPCAWALPSPILSCGAAGRVRNIDGGVPR